VRPGYLAFSQTHGSPDSKTLHPLRQCSSPLTSLVSFLWSLQELTDTSGSVDEDAFNRLPDVISGIDLIDDDLPTNLDYLDRSSRHSSKDIKTDQATGESLRSWQADDADSRFASEVIGETVKILFEEPFVMEEDYWENLPDVNSGYADEQV